MPARKSRRATKGQPPRRSPASAVSQIAKIQKSQTRPARPKATKTARKRPVRKSPDLESINQEESVVIRSSPPLIHTDIDDHTPSPRLPAPASPSVSPIPPTPPTPAPNKPFIYEWTALFDGEEIGAGSSTETLASNIDFEAFWVKSQQLSSDHALSNSVTNYRISTKASIGTKGGKNNTNPSIRSLEDWPGVRGIIETYQRTARNVLAVEIITYFSRYLDGKAKPVVPSKISPVEVTASKPEKATVRVSRVAGNVHIDMK